MQQDTLYLKLEKNVEVECENILLKDIGKLYSKNDNIVNRCKILKIGKIGDNEPVKKVISVMKVIQMITQEFPNISIQNIGETDTLVERVKVKSGKGIREKIKIFLVAVISFLGTCFTIMAFHNDIGIQKMFFNIQKLVIGDEATGYSILEISYSIGLALGIIVFFNHIGGRRITKDPTPIEVEMRIYEKDVNDSLIETASREEKEIDVS